MKINARLRLVREYYKESQAVFCKRFNLSQQTYANYELDGRKVPDDLKQRLYEELHINLNWLITGTGTMVMDGSLPEGEDDPFLPYGLYTYLVPMTNLRVSAGGGVEWNSGEVTGDMIPIPIETYRRYSSYTLGAARATGSSMEPTIKNGEAVIFARGLIEGDGIYVISILGELYVKRLSFDPLQKTLTIISDNPVYPAKTYPEEQDGLTILGKVVMWMHSEV